MLKTTAERKKEQRERFKASGNLESFKEKESKKQKERQSKTKRTMTIETKRTMHRIILLIQIWIHHIKHLKAQLKTLARANGKALARVKIICY